MHDRGAREQDPELVEGFGPAIMHAQVFAIEQPLPDLEAADANDFVPAWNQGVQQ